MMRQATIMNSQVFTKYVANIDIRPFTEVRQSLGLYNDEKDPKGFAIELNDSEGTEDEVNADFIKIERHDHKYELMLTLTNFGSNTIKADVWQM